MKYAPREVEKYLPKSNIISIKWMRRWFRGGYSWIDTMRIANALVLCIGPLSVVIRRRWLFGAAAQQHKEAFVKAGMEHLLYEQR